MSEYNMLGKDIDRQQLDGFVENSEFTSPDVTNMEEPVPYVIVYVKSM